MLDNVIKWLFPHSPKWQQRLSQFSKYLAGGSLYFWVGYGIFALGYSVFHWWWLWAKVLGDVIGWTMNYFIQRYWAFSGQHHLSEMQHAGRYIFIETIGFILDYAMIGGLKAIGISPYVGFFISGIFFTAWSWLWYKYWVFPEKKK
jgi:putative flippase GtrA